MSLYDTKKISEYLNERSKDIEIIVLENVDSTNDYAKRLVLAGWESKNILVLADEQSLGKGQYGRGFYSPKGKGIYMSLKTEPKIAGEVIPYITLMCGICVRDAIEKVCGVSCNLKYVNDVMFEGKKLCGILTESIFEGDECKAVVMGIGIDVFHVEYPDELRSVVTSLEENIAGKKKIDTDKLVGQTVNNIFDWLENFDKEKIIDKYSEYVLDLHKTNLLK